MQKTWTKKKVKGNAKIEEKNNSLSNYKIDLHEQ